MRKLWISFHLFAAAFLAPMLLLVAISGGLYLIGVKGSVTKTPVEISPGTTIDPKSETLEADVRGLLQVAGIDHSFEYVKISGSSLLTRPTSRVHYEINRADDEIKLTRNEPDLQSSMIELHKGHGPLLYKDFQKLMAVGVLFIVLSGLWLGLSSSGLRVKTLATSAAGLVVFLTLALVI